MAKWLDDFAGTAGDAIWDRNPTGEVTTWSDASSDPIANGPIAVAPYNQVYGEWSFDAEATSYTPGALTCLWFQGNATIVASQLDSGYEVCVQEDPTGLLKLTVYRIDAGVATVIFIEQDLDSTSTTITVRVTSKAGSLIDIALTATGTTPVDTVIVDQPDKSPNNLSYLFFNAIEGNLTVDNYYVGDSTEPSDVSANIYAATYSAGNPGVYQDFGTAQIYAATYSTGQPTPIEIFPQTSVYSATYSTGQPTLLDADFSDNFQDGQINPGFAIWDRPPNPNGGPTWIEVATTVVDSQEAIAKSPQSRQFGNIAFDISEGTVQGELMGVFFLTDSLTDDRPVNGSVLIAQVNAGQLELDLIEYVAGVPTSLGKYNTNATFGTIRIDTVDDTLGGADVSVLFNGSPVITQNAAAADRGTYVLMQPSALTFDNWVQGEGVAPPVETQCLDCGIEVLTYSDGVPYGSIPATLLGEVEVNGVASIDISPAIEITALGTVTVDGVADVSRRLGVTAEGTVNVVGFADIDIGNVIDVSPRGQVQVNGVAIADLQGNVSVIATGSVQVAAVADIDVISPIEVDALGTVTVDGSVDVDVLPAVEVTALGTVTVEGTASLTGDIEVTALGTVTVNGWATVDESWVEPFECFMFVRPVVKTVFKRECC